MQQLRYIALTALVLGLFQPAAMANDQSLPMRAVAGLSVFIANQGNAALAGIKKEIRKDVQEQLKPYLPQRREPGQEKPQPERPPAR